MPILSRNIWWEVVGGAAELANLSGVPLGSLGALVAKLADLAERTGANKFACKRVVQTCEGLLSTVQQHSHGLHDEGMRNVVQIFNTRLNIIRESMEALASRRPLRRAISARGDGETISTMENQISRLLAETSVAMILVNHRVLVGFHERQARITALRDRREAERPAAGPSVLTPAEAVARAYSSSRNGAPNSVADNDDQEQQRRFRQIEHGVVALVGQMAANNEGPNVTAIDSIAMLERVLDAEKENTDGQRYVRRKLHDFQSLREPPFSRGTSIVASTSRPTVPNVRSPSPARANADVRPHDASSVRSDVTQNSVQRQRADKPSINSYGGAQFDVIPDSEGRVLAERKEDLLEFLLSGSARCDLFIESFFLTSRLHGLVLKDVFRKLVDTFEGGRRYSVADNADIEQRVVFCIQTWMKVFYPDPEDIVGDNALLDALEAFIRKPHVDDFGILKELLRVHRRAIETFSRCEPGIPSATQQSSCGSISSQSNPLSVLYPATPSTGELAPRPTRSRSDISDRMRSSRDSQGNRTNIRDLLPQEISDQLTIVAAGLANNLWYGDLLLRLCHDKSNESRWPPIIRDWLWLERSIERWTKVVILEGTYRTSVHRAERYTKLANVAKLCFDRRNFLAANAIVNGLRSDDITKLKDTCLEAAGAVRRCGALQVDLMKERYMHLIKRLERERRHYIPQLAIHLEDLVPTYYSAVVPSQPGIINMEGSIELTKRLRDIVWYARQDSLPAENRAALQFIENELSAASLVLDHVISEKASELAAGERSMDARIGQIGMWGHP